MNPCFSRIVSIAMPVASSSRALPSHPSPSAAASNNADSSGAAIALAASTGLMPSPSVRSVSV